MKFYEKFKAAASLTAQIQDKVDKVNRVIEYYKRTKSLISAEKDFSSELSDAARTRAEFMEAKEKMDTLVDICGDLTSLAPHRYERIYPIQSRRIQSLRQSRENH